jgi:tetratricopeptide (TPR) repeat protein
MAWLWTALESFHEWLKTGLGSAVAGAVLGAILTALATMRFLPGVTWEIRSWLSATGLDLGSLLQRLLASGGTRRFRIALTRFSGDPRDRQSLRLFAALRRDAAGRGLSGEGIEVIWYRRTLLRLDDPDERAHRRALHWLRRLNADIIVTGRVTPHDDTVDVACATVQELRKEDGGLHWEPVSKRLLTESTPSLVHELTTELFKIYVLSKGDAYRDRRRERLHTLPDVFSDVLVQRIVGPEGDFPPGTVPSFIRAFAEHAERMTQRRGTSTWAKAAVKARQALCASIDRASRPEAWATAHIALGDAWLEHGTISEDEEAAEEALGAFESALGVFPHGAREHAQALRGRSVALRRLARFDAGSSREEAAVEAAQTALSIHDVRTDSEGDLDRLRATIALTAALEALHNRKGGSAEKLREAQRLAANAVDLVTPDAEPVLFGQAHTALANVAESLWVEEVLPSWLEMSEHAAREVVNGLARSEHRLVWASASLLEALVLFRRGEASDARHAYERAIPQFETFLETCGDAMPWQQAEARHYLCRSLVGLALGEWHDLSPPTEGEQANLRSRCEELFERADRAITEAIRAWPYQRSPMAHCWLLDGQVDMLWSRARMHPELAREPGAQMETADPAVPYLKRALEVLEHALAQVHDDAVYRRFRLTVLARVAGELGRRTDSADLLLRATTAARDALAVTDSAAGRAWTVSLLARLTLDRARAGDVPIHQVEWARDRVNAVLGELDAAQHPWRWTDLVTVRGDLHRALGDRRRDRSQRVEDYATAIADLGAAIASYETHGAQVPAELESRRVEAAGKLADAERKLAEAGRGRDDVA